MNFQHARNNPGKSEQIQGTAIKFDIKTHAEYGDYALGKMTDNLGETVEMFYAASNDSPLPDKGCMNKLCIWGVKYDANTQKYKAYFNGLVAQQLQPQQGQVTPYQPPQRPQTPPQQPNSAQGAVTDAQLLAFAERVLKLMESLAYPNANTTRPTQPSGSNPDYVGDDPAPPEDDIAF